MYAYAAPIDATQITQAAADAVFLGERLAPVAATLDLARKARRLMRENLGLSVFYNVFAVPLAMAGWLTPLIAAAAMSGSSILVTLNALRAGGGTHSLFSGSSEQSDAFVSATEQSPSMGAAE